MATTEETKIEETKTEEVIIDPNVVKIQELEKKLAEVEKDRKQAVEKRQKETEEKRQEAERAGKYQEAIDLLKGELETFKTKYADVDIESLKTTQQKYTELVDAQKKNILDKLPKDKQEKMKAYSLEQLMDIAQLIDLDVNIPTVESKKKTVIGTSGAKWGDLTPAEQDALYKADPVKGKQMLNEYLKEKAK